jgi:hypothetical protein
MSGASFGLAARITVALFAMVLVIAGPGSAAEGGLRLLMVEQDGCVYCARFDRDIAPIYEISAEGEIAPLLRTDLRGPLPDGVTLTRLVGVTPTFIMLDASGVEVTRMVGYPGDDFFWGFIGLMIEAAGGVIPPPPPLAQPIPAPALAN